MLSAKNAVSAPPREEQVVVKRSDMTPELETELIAVTLRALDECDADAGIAKRIRQALNARFPNSIWHIVMGRRFSCAVTHEARYAIYFYVATKAFFIFKSN